MSITITCREAQQGHAAIAQQLWPYVKSMTMAGHQIDIHATIHEDDRTLRQNRFYWGVVLKEISQQAKVGGISYASEAFHELFKRQFLGYKITKVTVAGRKRKLVTRTLKGTRDLKVKPMSDYLDKVQAYAATELGVQFSAPNWQQWSGVDPETGEIMGFHS